MNGTHLSVVLLPTSACNAACEYCFEDKRNDSLSLDRLGQILDKVLDHMDAQGKEALSIHWQGGEAMLLPPRWYRQAFDLIENAATARAKTIEHGLQSNMLAFSPAWVPIIAEMFGNSISTSFDYPNLYRKVPGHDPAHYDALWMSQVRQARAAGIDVKVISVPNRATLDLGAERFYTHLVEELGVTDFQINTPFPGGEVNDAKRALELDIAELARFHCELADIWLERGADQDVRIGPFDQLMNSFSQRDAILPCIWGRNCAEAFIAIDANGHVAQCDCWVTSYPEYRFGNILQSNSLSELLRDSPARRRFTERPVQLMQGDCIDCDHLALCHGGCPIRTYSVHHSLSEKDPYCELYKRLFRHIEDQATRLTGRHRF